MTERNVRKARGQRHFLGAAVAAVVAFAAVLGAASASHLDESIGARRAGDPAVLATLTSPETTRAARLEAIRRARFLRMPELALAPLAALAAGRDPQLAPEAVLIAHIIATELDPLTLEAHEVALRDLAPARAALGALGRDRTARPDIAALARNAAAHLRALGVP